MTLEEPPGGKRKICYCGYTAPVTSVNARPVTRPARDNNTNFNNTIKKLNNNSNILDGIRG